MRELRQVRRRAAVVSLAVSFFGLSFGVLAAEQGLSVAKAAAMSLLVFSGGSQFAAVSLADGSEVTAVVAALLLASRLTALGVLAAPMIAGPRWRQLLGAQVIVDETVLLALEHDEPALRRAAFWTTGIVLFASWNVVTLLGVAIGDALGNPATLGIDGAFPAVFVALLAPRLRAPGPQRRAGSGGDRGRPHTARARWRPRDRIGGRGARGRAGSHMTWTSILVLAGGVYVLKASAPVLLGDRPLPGRLARLADLLPAALLAALIAVSVVGGDRQVVVDARLAGLVAAVVAVSLRASFLVVVVAGCAATALARAV